MNKGLECDADLKEALVRSAVDRTEEEEEREEEEADVTHCLSGRWRSWSRSFRQDAQSPGDASSQRCSPSTRRRCRSDSKNSLEPGEGDQSSASVRPSRRSVHDLHDFTQEFVERGYHEEYCSWRDQYLRWRKGDAKGAKGENAHETHMRNQKKTFEYWYPTVSSWTLRRSASYWVAVFFTEGCILFIWVPVITLLPHDESSDLLYSVTSLPTWFGGTMFLIGCYLGYFELINMDTDVSEHVNYIWCDWRELITLLDKNPVTSILGWAVYFVGAVFFEVALTAALFDLSTALKYWLCDWPLVIGGSLFFVGGLCEVLHNDCFSTPPIYFVWWVSALNCCGGFTFWLCNVPSLCAGNCAAAVGGIGSFLYLIGGVLQLCMWRGEQFGLSLISALNRVHRDAGTQIAVRQDPQTGESQIVPMVSQVPGTAPPQFESMSNLVAPALSWRGIIFVFLYIISAAIQCLNFCASLKSAAKLAHSMSYSSGFRHFACSLLSGLTNMAVMHMVLMLSCACVKLPKEQPFRGLVLSVRTLVIFILLQSILRLEMYFEDDEFAQKITTADATPL